MPVLRRSFYKLLLSGLLIFIIFNGIAGAEEAAIGFSPEQLENIEKKVKPVLDGDPVMEIPEEDRRFLFLAEEIYPESYELFFRHGEYLALEKEEYTQAVPRLKKALEIEPKDVKTLELLATCYYALKEEADEVSCWESLREILEDFDENEAKDLRERVMMQLQRMANENAMVMRSGKRFIVYTPADSSYSYVADELTDRRLEEVYRQITGDLNCIPPFRTSIIVLSSQKFDEVKPTSWAGGFAKCDKSMVLNADSFPRSEPETILPAKSIVLHEFTHNIVFVAGGGRCPTWLNEGLAVYAENKEKGFTEFVPQIPTPDKIMNLEELEQEFADISQLGKESSERVSQAYRLAGLYARFLIQSFTLASPRQILNGLKGKVPFDELLYDVTEMTVPQFENRFKNWVSELARAN